MFNSPNVYPGNGRYGGGGYGSVPMQSAAAQTALLQRVSYLLCTALLVTAASAYLARDWSPALGLPLAIGTIVCVVVLSLTRRSPVLSLLLLYGLSVMEGLMMGPLLSAIIRGYPFGGIVVAEATALSGVIVAGLGTYVWISNKDFGYLGKVLFWALIGIIVISAVSFFWHSLAMLGGFQLAISMAIVAVFVGFTLYDFSNIKHRYSPNDYAIATVSLYLDFLNLFWAILRILMILGGGGGSSRRD